MMEKTKSKLIVAFYILSILTAFLFVFKITPAYASATTGRTNGLTLVLDTISSSVSVATIENFMNTWHYNAIKLYTGWGNSYWGVAWTGNVDSPIPTTAQTKIAQLLGNASENGWYVSCTISAQLTPASTNTTWRDLEVQCGYTGNINPTYYNYVDFAGTYGRRYQAGLVKTYTQLMETANIMPMIGFEELQYISDGGGYVSIYAECMTDAYYADTGLSAPAITYSSSVGSWTTAQRNYINYVNATCEDFQNAMVAAAWSINSSTMFEQMVDDIEVYPDTIWYTHPINYFGNTSVFSGIETEAFTKTGSRSWTALVAWLNIVQAWNPTAKARFTYSYYSGESASDILAAIPYVMDAGYWGVWAYGYNSGGSSFSSNPLDVSSLIPNTAYSNIGYDTTLAGASCQFSCYWTGSLGLSGYKFSWNSSGSWANETWTSMSNATTAWSNQTKTLPSSGTVVSWLFYANDSTNYWTTTTMQTFTTTGVSVDTVSLNFPSVYSSYNKTIQFTYTPKFYDAIYNATLWLNLTGTWQQAATNASSVQNNTVNSFTYSFSVSATYIWNVRVGNSSGILFGSANLTLTMYIEPYFGVVSTSDPQRGANCTIQAYLYDGNGLSYAYLCTNITGTMANETIISLSGTSYIANWTKTLPALVVDISIFYRIYVNDTDNNWSTSSDYYITLGEIIFVTGSWWGNWW